MSGWKTKLAGAGGIATGIGLVIAAITSSPFDSTNLVTGILTLLAGLGAIGLGHKLDKVKAVFEAILNDPADENKDTPQE